MIMLVSASKAFRASENNVYESCIDMVLENVTELLVFLVDTWE